MMKPHCTVWRQTLQTSGMAMTTSRRRDGPNFHFLRGNCHLNAIDAVRKGEAVANFEKDLIIELGISSWVFGVWAI